MNTRKHLPRLLVAVTVFATVLGMAATLGGIGGASVGADSATVDSCDSDGVTTSYTSAWDATDERYEVSSVTVGGVDDACDGESLNVTVTDSTGAQIGTGTLSIPTSAAVSHSVSLSTAADASTLSGVHVAIS